jgi:hypothetical protein
MKGLVLLMIIAILSFFLIYFWILSNQPSFSPAINQGFLTDVVFSPPNSVVVLMSTTLFVLIAYFVFGRVNGNS